ncbi:hypothetical protein E2P81_ATG02169 [Venturia nashicola]|uniref:Uncharacterized protein n=1 Tax=Venturia nashicola TaxID=86259 RepID=A0A4Z1P304_9PEZI|nr:hypothetical protein E6O75_ATG02221 [Venturia nashicola]TLD35866.1 hypothetical protein E2P81_ATG02169 [Venturia nashicola]
MSNSQNFSQYEFDSSDNAMSEYAKLMHKHTKQQLETASSSARRRSQGTSSTLTHESSNASRSSVSSTDL